MSEYLIIELENKNKYAVIDTLKYNGIVYFLVAQVSDDEKDIDENFIACKYNEEKNYFEQIENNDLYDLVISMFKEKLEYKSRIDNKLEAIKYDNMIKLKVKNIRDYDYTLEHENGQTIIKNIEFFSKKPLIGSYIYIDDSILNENMLQYGNIYDSSRITKEEIIKIEIEEDEYYLQRYYG